MTGPVTTEALVEARELVRQSLKGGAPGLTEATREAVVGSIMLKITNKVLAPLLAAHQQVTAERDEAREVVARCNNSFGSYSYHLNPHPAEQIEKVKWQARSEWQRAEAAEASLATATSELARLRAEGEAKDRALKILLPFVDYAAGEGLMFRGSDDTDRPDMDAADLCIAATAALGLELGDPDYCALVEQGEQEITALARAATAREG